MTNELDMTKTRKTVRCLRCNHLQKTKNIFTSENITYLLLHSPKTIPTSEEYYWWNDRFKLENFFRWITIPLSSKKFHQTFCTKNKENIAKGTTDPGVDCFDQKFWFGRPSSVCLVGYLWFGLVGLVWQLWFGRFGLVGLVW